MSTLVSVVFVGAALGLIYLDHRRQQRAVAIETLRLKLENAIAVSHQAICLANLEIGRVNRLVKSDTPSLSSKHLWAAKIKLHNFHEALGHVTDDRVLYDPWMDSFCRLETDAIEAIVATAIAESDKRMN